MKIKVVALNCRFTHSCLALFYVRNELRKYLPSHCTVELCQFTINDPYFDTLLRLTHNSPDAVFFSVYVWNEEITRRLAQDIIAILPNISIVFGGPQAAFMGGADFSRPATLVRGEVEGLPQTFYKDLANKALQQEYPADEGRDFGFPYKDEDFTGPLKNRHIYYESSRGCPFSCTYCLSSTSKGARFKDMEAVKKELQMLLDRQPQSVRFVDRTFNAKPARALEIWRFLLERQNKTVFHFEIAADIFTEEMLQFLETVPPGLFRFEIGVQSTNRDSLSAVNRHSDFKKIRRSITKLMSFDNIHIHVDLILGLPYETKTSFRRSFNDVFALLPHYIQMGHLKILPGTAIAQERDFNMVWCSRPPYEIAATGWMDHTTIRMLHWFGEMVEAFYNNRFFRKVWHYIRNNEKDFFGFFENLYSVCSRQGFFDLAKTQDKMSRMLFEAATDRVDREIFLEILRYDWLRSGRQSLPDFLCAATQNDVKKMLKKSLPQNMPGFYDPWSRNQFFRQCSFAIFSGEALKVLGFQHEKEKGIVIFLPKMTKGATPARKAKLISDTD